MNVFSYFAIAFFLLHAALLPAAEGDLIDIEDGSVLRHGNQNFISLQRSQGQTIFTRSNYTTLSGFIFPKTDQNILPFADVNFHAFDNGDYATNMGGGIRFLPATSSMVFGVNAYYDYRKFHRANFNQMGIGFEALGEFWNFRLNGYLPVGKHDYRLSRCIFDDYIGDYFIVKDRRSRGSAGLDFEIEALIADRDTWGAHIAAGTYYFRNSKGCSGNAFGGLGRISADFGRYFNLGVLVTYDNVFKTKVQGQLSVTVPFSFTYDEVSFTAANLRVYRPVQRQDMMILNNSCRWFWNY